MSKVSWSITKCSPYKLSKRKWYLSLNEKLAINLYKRKYSNRQKNGVNRLGHQPGKKKYTLHELENKV